MNINDIKNCIEAKEFKQRVSIYEYLKGGKHKFLCTIIANSVNEVFEYLNKKKKGSGVYTFKFLKKVVD
jgi:hypothetical protein